MLTSFKLVSIIFLLKLLNFQYVFTFENYTNCTPQTTRYTHFRNSILTRRTRGIIFPNKAFVLLSPAFTKAIIDGRPSGLSYSIEFDMYSPLPDTIDGWKPTILINKANREKAQEEGKPPAPMMAEMPKNPKMPDAPAPAPMSQSIATPKPAIFSYDDMKDMTMIDDLDGDGDDNARPLSSMNSNDQGDGDGNDDDGDQSDYNDGMMAMDPKRIGIEDTENMPYFLPNNAIKGFHFPITGMSDDDDSDEQYMYDVPTEARRYDENLYGSYNFNGGNKVREFNTRNYYSAYNSNNIVHESPNLDVIKQFHKIPSLKSTKPKSIAKSKMNFQNPKEKFTKNIKKNKNSVYEEKWSDFGPTLRGYKIAPDVPFGYRERREIYDQLEVVGKIFKINIKACIKRAMCEMQTYLRPFGESLMEDILRILLTVPNERSPSIMADDDEYRHEAYRNINCVEHFALTCPYRVLEFLIENIKNIHLPM